jgi:hypothetical protein
VPSAAEAYPNRLDLSVVHRHKRHDKLGNKRLLQDFKIYYLGYRTGKLTRKQCDEFLDNAANFVSQPNQSAAEQCWSDFAEERTWNGERLKKGKTMRALDAMFVWTPDREGFQTYPLRGKIDVTTIPESDDTRQHPMSFGACNDSWDDDVGRWQMAQRLVTMLLHEDNIPEEEVRSAFMQVDEFATFPFSTEVPEDAKGNFASLKNDPAFLPCGPEVGLSPDCR